MVSFGLSSRFPPPPPPDDYSLLIRLSLMKIKLGSCAGYLQLLESGVKEVDFVIDVERVYNPPGRLPGLQRALALIPAELDRRRNSALAAVVIGFAAAHVAAGRCGPRDVRSLDVTISSGSHVAEIDVGIVIRQRRYVIDAE